MHLSINRKGKGKCEGRKYLTDRNPELFDLVVSYRKKIDRKTHQPFSYRKISALIKEEHNLSISFNSVKRILLTSLYIQQFNLKNINDLLPTLTLLVGTVTKWFFCGESTSAKGNCSFLNFFTPIWID